MIDELNEISYDGSSLLIDVLNKYHNNKDYLPIIVKLLNNKIRLDIPAYDPPLNNYIGNKPNVK